MIVCDATVSIAPIVLASLSLALCSMADPKRLGKIAGKTIGTFVGFYVCGATLDCLHTLSNPWDGSL